MGDAVFVAGNAPPANPTTNAGNSGAAADVAQFGEALQQESLPLCPEGLHRPHKVDAPCTYLRFPSQSSQSQSSQSSKPNLQLDHFPTNLIRGPTNDPNGPGYDNYKNRTPPERDPNPTHGLNPPSVPGNPSYNTGPNGDAHVITVPVGKQAPKPTPDQEQNQTPYPPPNSPGK